MTRTRKGRLASVAGVGIWFFIAAAAAGAATITVCPSGCGYAAIQTGVNAAATDDTVLVGDGVYGELVTIAKRISVRSLNGAAATVIDGGGGGRVVTLNSGAVLDGFTVRNGRVTTKDGAGIKIDNATVSNCVIVGNLASSRAGGGIFAVSASIRNCTVTGNAAQEGGGIWAFNSSLADCVVSGNTGAGVTLWGSVLDHCTVSGNSGSGTTAGGVLAGDLAFPGERTTMIRNCTIAGNTSPTGGGGVSTLPNTKVWVLNSIVRGNASGQGAAAAEVLVASGTILDMRYSAVGGGWAGTGNIASDPLLANPRPASEAPTTAGDYHLLTGSPCIDRGETTVATQDVDGDSCPVGGGYDIGSDEFVSTADLPPTLDPIADVSLEQGATLTVPLTGITAGPGETQTLTVEALSSDPTLVPPPVVRYDSPNTTGSLEVTASATAAGSTTILVSVSDGPGVFPGVTRSFIVTVTAANKAPTLDPLGAVSVAEDALPQVVSLSGISAGAGESQVLSVSASSSDTGVVPQPGVSYTTPGATGTLSFRPAANANGTATIQVTVSDGAAVNGTTSRSFAVTVRPVNDAPSFAKGADQIVTDNAGAQTVPGWASSLSAGPADESGQTLSFSVTSDNGSLFAAPPAVDAAGTLRFTPATGDGGSATVTVRLRDSGGTADGGVDQSPPQTFTVTVLPSAPPNHAPVLAPVGDRTVEEGQTLEIVVSATDPDAGDTLSFSATGLPAGATFDGSTFLWTPDPSQVPGAYPVRFEVSDGLATDAEEILVTVTPAGALLFADDYRDGTVNGDLQWAKRSGSWAVDRQKHYQALSVSRTNLSTVKPEYLAPLAAGRIETSLMIRPLLALNQNALVVFACQSTLQYRYVQVLTGRIRIGQVGTFGGRGAGYVQATVGTRAGVLYAVRVDVFPDGRVDAYLGDRLVLSARFPEAAAGAVGVGAAKNGARFDAFQVSGESVLP
jgi:hypothetical protein